MISGRQTDEHCTGAKIAYSSFLVSSEQAPEKERTLRKQRLRWAQGWFEVFSKHSLALFLSPHIGLRQKLGFFILLPFRELFVYFTFHPIILLVIYQIRHGDLDVAIFFIASGAAMLSVGFFRIIAAYFLAKGHVGRWPGAFIVFLLVQVFWVAYLNFLQVSIWFSVSMSTQLYCSLAKY
jgi:cellulose synthase/poly-beta-1,6-N-acetylglucosamine synthase-like glycosyltransferase